jgi:UDP-4-amino-4-deoxy-L-arabinose-oxoglutarate aminotransferase
VGLSTCTAALFLTLKAWGLGKGDKVIVPAMTFIASSNVVLHAGSEVAFCDVEPKTGLLDLNMVEDILRRDPKVRAIIPVHLYGQMVDMKNLRRLADQHHVRILEDSAHCVEGIRDGVRPGQLGDAAAFSFYATKNLTSGEGGAAVTNDEALARRLRIIRLHGMSESAVDRHQFYQHWDMAEPGYKENMFELQAALLLSQLPRLEGFWQKREALAQKYETAFSAAGIAFPATLPGVKNARHLFTVWAPDGRRDDVLAYLQQQGIGVVVNYRAVHLREYYQKVLGFREGDFPVAEEIGRRTISLPFYPGLKPGEIDYVIDKVVAAHNA